MEFGENHYGDPQDYWMVYPAIKRGNGKPFHLQMILQNPEKHPIYRGSFPYVPLFSHIFPAISPFLKIGISQHRHPRHHVATVATARLQQETFQLFRTQHVTLMIRGLAQTDRSYT
jgi:hypothetical protein